MAVSELPMSGRYMIQNAMAAFGICHLIGVDKAIAVAAMREYAGLPHRMVERVPVNGVRFINDSKGTNVGASDRDFEYESRRSFVLACRR